MSKGLLLALFLITASAQAGSNMGYDPQVDPFDQYHSAIEQARAEHKRVLIIAGGDWCRWCHALDRFVTHNDDVNAALHDAFVVVKVYIGDENYNDLFFSQLPEARGAPHFWIVSPDRNVLTSQATAKFEKGKGGYDKREFLQFIDQWKQRDHSEAVALTR